MARLEQTNTWDRSKETNMATLFAGLKEGRDFESMMLDRAFQVAHWKRILLPKQEMQKMQV